jgi:hypothetical protein
MAAAPQRHLLRLSIQIGRVQKLYHSRDPSIQVTSQGRQPGFLASLAASSMQKRGSRKTGSLGEYLLGLS